MAIVVNGSIYKVHCEQRRPSERGAVEATPLETFE